MEEDLKPRTVCSECGRPLEEEVLLKTSLAGVSRSLKKPRTVRCSGCGRFHGFVILLDGVVLLKCKNCKEFTLIAEGPTGEVLTTRAIYDMVQVEQGQ
jgi:DNA-directed RNA polymerase subunit RPC12/RpoP